ncbi:MAG: bifunctional hydroxymethylpyrimidine kinase/phosphomethylpyrimidine kinase [Candidatus Eisenbacteria sp.]|nr:bifunctional hydroxymethylpyrimidine kinase/phosphomethylpyrimidine kinase [Candidatus Eisenbacteria bacterium]
MGLTPKQILVIGGSDSGSGAGVEADLKSIHANGGYALVAITSVTAQNTREVVSALELPAEIIQAQIAAVCADFEVAAVKTGMLGSREIVIAVATELAKCGDAPLVIDPVMISTSGFPLLAQSAIDALREHLLPSARLCTPNRHEAEALSGLKIGGLQDVEVAARRIRDLGPCAVLVKGGHIEGERAVDLLLDGDEVHIYESERIEKRNTHGTGCTMSAAIATWLARGAQLPEAVSRAKQFITLAIRHALEVGQGDRPTDPFFFLQGRDWSAFL